MQKTYLFLTVLICISFSGYSQQLKGQVIDAKTKKPLSTAHILNLNSVVGTITNEKGLFEVTSKANDTVLVSFIGFSSIKLKVTNDLLKGNEVVISLQEKPEEIKEVVIKSTALIGVLEIDVKQVPKDKFTRIHINGLPQTYEIGKPQKITSPISKLLNPVDLIYNLFGRKPKQLKKLQKLKKKDDLRKMLAGKFDREVMMEYLEMDKQELNKLLTDCDYSAYFIKKASDLQIIEAVLNCYENYKVRKKGKIEINRVPDRN
ncbi:carboxypeptidase-like regulatory domain-containing protein [Tenacibaculum dicentrarchi]|nr:carboxypeptidase-like regulatory domain-containing protein [Tenacibaculum dicentrarchi]MCD8420621.1 carboxypeptidase-like regulatory domain-containing protein [Tenacibaculum dicentrarchi]MCD8437807.1 carboxypeptidase-like regulatory domain-containing protein [Tenacibaculum dicentrarchi]MCD8452323.1 carboxypeptidase-like regulatory domain-containing protein [Tenacibaculum dicentrarchi]MCG8828602.1 carboxypeptidase-like regulatory domain-containing protein [Tenacibaculum dicentrarchi]